MTLRPILLASTFCATLLATAQASEPAVTLVAGADCSRAAADAAAQTGGRVLTVSSRSQDGRAVCVVTVIVPSDNGGRPRKQTLVMPQ